jgi:phosphatidate phosphatase PAH1
MLKISLQQIANIFTTKNYNKNNKIKYYCTRAPGQLTSQKSSIRKFERALLHASLEAGSAKDAYLACRAY